MELADRLRITRKALNLSQKDIALIFGMTQAGYSRIERGEIIPTSDKLITLVNKFPQINSEWLLTGNGNGKIYQSPQISLSDRLKIIRTSLNLNYKDFANRLGVYTLEYINLEKKENDKLPDGFLLKLKEAYPEINTSWLLTGNGEILKEAPGNINIQGDGNVSNTGGISNSTINAGKITHPSNDTAITTQPSDKEKYGLSNVRFIPNPQYIDALFVPIQAHAGFAHGYGNAVFEKELTTVPVFADKEYKGKYYVFEVSGDSMDDDSRSAICHRDQILAREVKTDYWKYKLHYKQWFFVIAHKEFGVVVKQIIDHNVETGDITCHSLNPEYDNFTWNLKDITGIFNVVKITERSIRL